MVAFALMFAAASPSPATAQSILGPQEQALLDAVNRHRAEAGLAQLGVSPTLTAAAAWMAQDLAHRDLLDHTDSMGRGIRARFSAFGYPSNTAIAENLYAGSSEPQIAADRWMASPGHRANSLNGAYTAAGIGLVHGPDTQYGYFWVITFGSELDAGGSPPPPPPPPPPPSSGAPGRTAAGFSQPFPAWGYAFNTWSGGSSQQMIDAVAGAGGRSLFVSSGGRLIGHVIGAPAFVNADFAAMFPGGQVSAGTGVLVVM